MTEETPAEYQVRYVGTGRRTKWWWPAREDEGLWRQRLAKEQEDICIDMTQQGLRLVNVVPVLSSTGFQGAWTEGVWLYFAGAERSTR